MRINSPIYLLGVLAALFAAVFVAGQLPYMFLYVLLLCTLLPLFGLYRSLKRLEGEVVVASRNVEAGRPVDVTFTVTNSTRGRFPYLALTNDAAMFSQKSVLLSLGPEESREIRTQVTPSRRGTYDLSSVAVSTGDPFGLFRISRPLAHGGTLKVYPRLLHLTNEVLPAYRRPGNHRTPAAAHDDPSEQERLRLWRSGDRVRNIHWRQTARQGQVVVRNMERAADTELAILIDMDKKAYRADRDHRLEDLAVELVASLAYNRLRDNHPVRVFVDPQGSGWIKATRFSDYESILDALIDLAPTQEETVYSSLHRHSYSLPAGTSINVASPALSLADADFLLSLKKRGFPVTLFHLRVDPPDNATEKLLGRMRTSGVNVHVLYPTERAQGHVDNL
jgi:uncharacterized protein (DUF58 family)